MEYKIKRFSKKPVGDRELVDHTTAERAKKTSVIQKKPNGKWGIISFKTTKPTWWPSDFETEAKALSSLRGYEYNKHKN